MSEQNINTLESAMSILDKQKEGIPFEAISYLRNQPSSEKLTQKIIFALEHAYDETTFYDEYEDFFYPAPLWYAIVAEEHICQELIDPVISLFTANDSNWDFLHEQGSYLVGRLTVEYSDLMIGRVVETIEKMIEQQTNYPYLYLFDVFYYADVEKYKDWLLETLKKDFYWRDSFSHHLGELQIKEAIPIIKDILSREKDEHQIIEYEETLEELETGVNKYPEQSKPFYETRGNWKEHYLTMEDRFYDDEDDEIDDEMQMPVRVVKIGRNEPCPCGSGKKYKKCCLSKNETY